MVKIVHSQGHSLGAAVGLVAGLGKMGYDAHKKAQAKREEEETAAAEQAEADAKQQELREMLAYEGAPAAEAAVGPTGPVLQDQGPIDLRRDPVFMEQVAGLPKDRRDLMMYLAEAKYEGEREQQARASIRNMIEMGGELLQNDMESVQMIVEGMESGLIEPARAAEAIRDKLSSVNLQMARQQVAQSKVQELNTAFGSMIETSDAATQQQAYALLADVQAGVVSPDEAKGEMFRIMAQAHEAAMKSGAPAPGSGAMAPATKATEATEGEGGSDGDLLKQIHADKDELEELRKGHRYGPGETPPTDDEIESYVPPGDLQRVDGGHAKKNRPAVSGGKAARFNDRSKK